MPKPPRTERFFIAGPAGQLEALLEEPAEQETRGGAVICHPHPQQGGTLQNKVVHTLARAFQHRGMRSLRFNFRGVGESAGEFDDARGETDDAQAAVTFLQSKWPGDPVWLAGFSFGAAVAIRLASREAVAGLVSVAPAVYRFAGDARLAGEVRLAGDVRLAGKVERLPQCPWLIVHGEQDEVVAVDETLEWVNDLPPGPELLVLPGAGHFFHGKLVQLREAVDAFLGAQTGA